MKKTFQIIGIAFLTCFSFYYTDKMVELSKNKDPLMIEIVSKQDDFNTYAMESVIYDDYILSGTKGKVVNVKESYKLGKYLLLANSRCIFAAYLRIQSNLINLRI